MIDENKKTNTTPVGASWREKVDKIKEYERLTRGKLDRSDFIPFFISPYEIEQGQRLKNKLLKMYKGRKVENIFNGETFKTNKGLCYCITNSLNLEITKPDSETARNKILGCFKLLYGIGDCKERRLKDRGFMTMADMVDHPIHGKEAKNILSLLNQNNTQGLIDVCHRWLPKSHPLVLSLSGFHDLSDFVFIDIETMGLYLRPIILFGIAYFQNDQLYVKQYLLRSVAEEPASLLATLSHIKSNSVFVSYNGKAFDIPYIRQRSVYYRLKTELNQPHFDLLHFSRRKWRGKLPDCTLRTIEERVLGIKRQDDVPSALIPDFYAAYMLEDNPGPLVPIVEHNRHDLVALARLFSILCQQMDK